MTMFRVKLRRNGDLIVRAPDAGTANAIGILVATADDMRQAICNAQCAAGIRTVEALPDAELVKQLIWVQSDADFERVPG